jgi:hypothetical protein
MRSAQVATNSFFRHTADPASEKTTCSGLLFFWDVKSCRVKGIDVSEQHAVFIFGAEGDNTFF